MSEEAPQPGGRISGDHPLLIVNTGMARAIQEETSDLLFLDEFTHALAFRTDSRGCGCEVLVSHTGFQHVIITVRDAPPELVGVADLVTGMRKVKSRLPRASRPRRASSGESGQSRA